LPREETRLHVLRSGLTRPIAKFENGRRKVCSTRRSRAHTARFPAREQPADPEPKSRQGIPAEQLLERVERPGVAVDLLEARVADLRGTSVRIRSPACTGSRSSRLKERNSARSPSPAETSTPAT